MSPQPIIDVLDVSTLSYEERVVVAAAQGMLNRAGPRVFLDYGCYDDPAARRTNEVFMDDEHWHGKYRALLGNQDENNLEYYRAAHGFKTRKVRDLESLLRANLTAFKGCVVYDDTLPDTINLAVMLAGLEDLLPLSPALAQRFASLNLPVRHDLRGRWRNRLAVYAWAFQHLFPRCKVGQLACVEPGWGRPEFLDYLVQNRIFTYSLASSAKGFGATLLLLLSFGPPRLREALFALGIDRLLSRLALAWMGAQNKEVALANRIQRAVKALPTPTIFGWHTLRDDELAFMFQLSANGLRLVPSHLAGNFSFHSRVQPLGAFIPDPLPEVTLDPQGVYVTFTLSDGDQLMMMNTAELGSWRSPARGSVPFNWECQPLLVEMAPTLLERFTSTKTSNDCLIAGPSGAGYIVPPLAPRFDAYMRESARVCARAGIRVITSYVADPPARLLRQLDRHKGDLLGYLSGYAVVSRAPQTLVNGTPVIANEIPLAANIWDEPEQIFEHLQGLIKSSDKTPRFIGVHLFAYRTTLEDVARFILTHKSEHLHFVRADEFLIAARQHLQSSHH